MSRKINILFTNKKKGTLMTGLEFPNISPIIFSIGGFALRWYSMAYLVGIIAAWWAILRITKKYELNLTKQQIEDMIFFITLGIIIGGRLGYVIFYGQGFFWHHPLKIFAIWNGGMSFHGGAVGAALGLLYTAHSRKVDFWLLTDLAALFAPIGIFLGRLANFINDELWGRVTDVPWAVRFPSGGFLPRHPSQLYEAFTEGLGILIILNLLWLCKPIRERRGIISALFIILYASFRILLEYFRQPDKQLGFLWEGFTMGQILSLPILVFGLGLLGYSIAKPQK